jgi:trans-aconitate methyltransferase
LDFFALAERVAETLDIGPGTRVFEVDCGNGDFLFPLYSNGYGVGGTDEDPTAIANAIKQMPDGVFSVAMASALDPATAWDVVVCRSMHGRADVDQVRGLVARMFAKATHAIALLDMPEAHQRLLVHTLAEVGATAVQVEGADVFARV